MPIKKAKEPKAPKTKKMRPPKEKKPKKPKKAKPPKGKKVQKGTNAPEEAEGQEEGQQPKKKLPLPLLLISLAVIVAAAVIVFLFVIRPRLSAGDEDPDATATVEPEPPVLPTEIPIGDDASIVGMALEADESGAQAEKAKTITYTYTNLNDAGKAAATYVGQLAKESPSFSLVDEEFVRQTDDEQPDYTAEEGMVLLARNAPVVEPEEPEEPEPKEEEPQPGAVQGVLAGGKGGFDAGLVEPLPIPVEEPITYVHTVRITWSPGVCVVTADEKEGKVTSPANNTIPAGQALSIRGAQNRMREMAPVQLGLEGESMDEYEIIPMDATEQVNDMTCIRINVYNGSDAAAPNQFRGSYLMSVDGLHMYRLDTATDEIVELEDYP